MEGFLENCGHTLTKTLKKTQKNIQETSFYLKAHRSLKVIAKLGTIHEQFAWQVCIVSYKKYNIWIISSEETVNFVKLWQYHSSNETI